MKKNNDAPKIKIPDTGPNETAHTVVGDYIVFVTIKHDQDCSSPEENYGFGKFWSLSRKHSNHKSMEEIQDLIDENPDAVKLSYYEHGNCSWFVPGETDTIYPDMQWDGVQFAGLWVPDEGVKESYEGQDGLTREQWMRKQAQSACKEYSDWCNGYCHGYIVKAYKARYEDNDLYDRRDDYRHNQDIYDDSCWGFIGDYVLEAAKEAADGALKEIQKRMGKKK